MTIFENDLFVIVRLAFPTAKKVIVLDPAKVVVRNFDCGYFYAYTRDQVMSVSKEKKQFVLVNISEATCFTFPFDFSFIEGIISFNTDPETSLEFYHFGLYYIVDQQNRLRWLISEKHKQTDFLQDYYQPQFITDVSNFFSGFSSIFNYLKVKLGKLKKVVDGSCQILKRDKEFFASFSNDQYKSFAINLKSHTAAGLIRIRFYDYENKLSGVMNHAINATGKEKLIIEKRVLSEISKARYNYFGIPEYNTSDYNVTYKLDASFKSSDSRQTIKLLNTILSNAILEYQNIYKRETILKKYWRANEILRDLNWIRSKISESQIPRGISAINLTKLYSNLLHIFNECNLNDQMYQTLNNNLLYSENIFSSNGKLYFTSWANADFDLPLFYDLFQREVFYAEETATADSDKMSEYILIELENQNLKTFAEQNNIKIDIHFKTFIINTFIDEIKQLLIKKIVLPETNVKIFNWLEVTNRAKNVLK